MQDKMGLVQKTFAEVLGESTYSNGRFTYDDYHEQKVKEYHGKLLEAMLVAIRRAPKHYTTKGSGMDAEVVPAVLVSDLLGE